MIIYSKSQKEKGYLRPIRQKKAEVITIIAVSVLGIIVVSALLINLWQTWKLKCVGGMNSIFEEGDEIMARNLGHSLSRYPTHPSRIEKEDTSESIWDKLSRRFSSSKSEFGSNSYYFVRNLSEGNSMDFLSGEVYEIQPHDYTFAKPVTIILLYKGNEIVESSELLFFKLNKYDFDILSSDVDIVGGCESEGLYETSSNIGSAGGIISLDEISLEIPSEALNESVEFRITKHRILCNSSVCGDGVCSSGESFSSCPEDCFLNWDGLNVSEAISLINSSFKIVIGQDAQASDNIAAIDIAGEFEISETILDSQADINENIIVIGGPAVNSKSAELLGLDYPTYGLDSGIPEGKGLIGVFNNNGNTQILIAGWDAIDTRVAARVLVRHEEFVGSLNKNPVVISGSLDEPIVE